MKKLLINRDLDVFSQDVNKNRPDQVRRLFEQCDRYKSETLCKEHPKKSSTFMGFACANLSLAYLISGDKSYLTEAKRWMMQVVNYEKWGHAFLVNVDLSASFILYGLSLSYNWLYEELSDEERKLIEDKLMLQGQIMYDFKIETAGSGWSTNYWQNHNWINMTGLSMAAYALEDKYPEVNSWLEESRSNFERVFDYFADDGSNYEGTVYWRYGVIWMLMYADLEATQGGVNYFEKSAYLKNTFFYRLYQAVPGYKDIINFGDCHDRKSSHSLAMYYKFASEYDNGYAQYLGDKVANEFMYQEQYESGVRPGVLPEAFLELLWYNPKVEAKAPNDLPLTYHFDDLGLITQRSSWDDDATILSFKSSAPGGKKQWKKTLELFNKEDTECFGLSHHHPDNNSFVLYSQGSYLFIDEGYNRNIKAHEHNIVSVDDQQLKVMDCNNVYRDSFFEEAKDVNFDPMSFVGEIKHVHNDENLSIFSAEASGTYDRSLNLKRFERSFVNTNNGYYLIIDQLESTDEHTYTQHFHTDNWPTQKANTFNYQNRLVKYSLTSVSDVETKTSLTPTDVRAVMTTQEPDKFRETNMKTLNIATSEKQQNATFCTLINLNTENKITLTQEIVEGHLTLRISGENFTDEVIVSSENLIVKNDSFTYKK